MEKSSLPAVSRKKKILALAMQSDRKNSQPKTFFESNSGATTNLT